jgi:predicted metal-dependent phosphoesterase TrpH
VDRSGNGVPSLNSADSGSLETIDLHVHSTASDGSLTPEAVVKRAAAVGLHAVGLTDHDTVAGVAEALNAGERLGVRVVSGCEFSVAASWGEMHVLGYFLPPDSSELENFLERCRADRMRRAQEMVQQLQRHGVELPFESVLEESAGGAVGRPQVARAIVRHGGAIDPSDAFDRWIGRGRPAFVEKTLPSFAAVATVVHDAGGVVSVAHLKERGTRAVVERLRARAWTRSRRVTRVTIRTCAPGSPILHSSSDSSAQVVATGTAIRSPACLTQLSDRSRFLGNGWIGWMSFEPGL